MKKIHLKNLALMGISTGALLATNTVGAVQNHGNTEKTFITDAYATKMTEADLTKKLSDEGKKTFNSLDAEGKALALKLANQSCKGQNDCKGLNSCKTEKNTCAGQGGCKGTSPGPFVDKDTAVKVAAKKMADKRAGVK